MAVGAPHVALGDLRLDHLPGHRGQHARDVGPLDDALTMVEVENAEVVLAAVHARVRGQVVGQPPLVVGPHPRDALVAGTPKALDVDRVVLTCALTAPGLPAVGRGTPLVELLERLGLMTGAAPLHPVTVCTGYDTSAWAATDSNGQPED